LGTDRSLLFGGSINEQIDWLKQESPRFQAGECQKVHERAPLQGVPITQAKGKNAKEAASDYRRVADELLREWGSR